MPPITEADVVDAVEKIPSKQPNGRATIAELIPITLRSQRKIGRSLPHGPTSLCGTSKFATSRHKNFGYGRLVQMPGGLALASKIATT